MVWTYYHTYHNHIVSGGINVLNQDYLHRLTSTDNVLVCLSKAFVKYSAVALINPKDCNNIGNFSLSDLSTYREALRKSTWRSFTSGSHFRRKWTSSLVTLWRHISHNRNSKGIPTNPPVSILEVKIPHLNCANTDLSRFESNSFTYSSVWHTSLYSTYVRNLGT